LGELALDRTQLRGVRKTALAALQNVPALDVYGLYFDIAANDPDEEVQQNAIYYIGQHSKDKVKSIDLLAQLFEKLSQDRMLGLRSCLYAVASVGNNERWIFWSK
jgi:hypothetical protein